MSLDFWGQGCLQHNVQPYQTHSSDWGGKPSTTRHELGAALIYLLGKRQLPLLTVLPVCAWALPSRRTQKVQREQRSL